MNKFSCIYINTDLNANYETIDVYNINFKTTLETEYVNYEHTRFGRL